MKISLSPRRLGGQSAFSDRFASNRRASLTRGYRIAFYSVGLLCWSAVTARAQLPLGPLTALDPVPPTAPAPRGASPRPVAPRPAAPATVIAPGAAVAAPVVPPSPVVPGLNVLIVAFDEVSPPTAPLAPLPVLPTPSGAAPGIPAPAPLNALPPLAPTTWNGPGVPTGGIRWEAQAQKKRDKDDNLFLPIPEPSDSTIGRRSRAESAAIAAEAAAKAYGSPTAPVGSLAPLPGTSPPGADLFPPLLSPQVMAPLSSAAPAGRSQQAGTSLRRALMARGYTDVLTTAPDGVTMVRALGEKRLTGRVLDDLRRALGALAVPGAVDQNALAASKLAAARVGQALGYQAVVALYVSPPVADASGATSKSAWNAVLVDSTRERGEPLLFDQSSPATGTETSALDAGAATGAALLDRSLQTWLIPSTADKVNLASTHLATAQAAYAAKDFASAQDEVNQTLALDPVRGEAYVLLGDLLKDSDPLGAANAFRRAVEINARDGATWAKISGAYVTSTPPDWPRALEAGRRALATGYDTVDLRVAMATAQYGRSELFRKANSVQRAEDADLEAKSHLDRALALAPENPSAVRLLANTLLAQRRYTEATQTLDRIAPRFPNDPEIQRQYANALSNQPGREEDAFVAYSRMWRQTGQKAVTVDNTTYLTLAQGFDLRLFNLGKMATQISAGVATGAVARESALLQLSKLKDDMEAANTAINTLQAPLSVSPTVAASRVFAADLMSQVLEAHQIYLETGQPLYRSRGIELYRQAVNRLNAARTAA